MNVIVSQHETFNSRSFAGTGLTKDQAGALLEKGWSRKDLRKISEGGMFSLAASYALKGEVGRVNNVFATFAFAAVGIGMIATGIVSAHNNLSHSPDFPSTNTLLDSNDSITHPNIDSVSIGSFLSPMIDIPPVKDQSLDMVFSLDVENHIVSNGLNFQFINGISETSASIKNVECGVDSAVPQPLTFVDQKTGATVAYDLCAVDLNVANKDYSASILVDINGGTLGREWMMLSESNTPLRGSALLLPLKNGTYNTNDPEAKRLEFLQTVDGSTVFHLNEVMGIGSSYKVTYGKEDPIPAVYSRLKNVLSKSGNEELLKSLLPEAPENINVLSQPNSPRAEVPIYRETVSLVSEGYTVDQQRLIDQYVDDFPELDEVLPKRIIEIENIGLEQITVIDFSRENIKINSEALGLTYDYFAKLAMQGRQSTNAEVTFEVNLNPSPDIIIGLIPSRVADNNFTIGKEGVAFTYWARSPQEANSSYIRLIEDPYKPVSKDDLPRTVAEDVTYSIVTEICQATNKVSAINFPYPMFRDPLGASMFSQELWCGSMSTAWLFKQKGATYNEYVKFANSVGFYLKGGTSENVWVNMIVVPEADYNSIKSTDMIVQ
ncbi:hypothetical protein KBD75_00020 [Candidatus Woesebacteria bacterium]|nr:hypothetical protein [Candidatus Woesebacteria bacterium]